MSDVGDVELDESVDVGGVVESVTIASERVGPGGVIGVASAGADDGSDDVGGVVVADDAVDEGVACGADVPVEGGVEAGADEAGDDIGMTPIVSVTTGRPANRSTGVFVRAIPDVPASWCVSVTTRTRWRAGRVACVGDAACAFVCASGGSGASRCTVGTRSSGNFATGRANGVSGFAAAAAAACCRSATPIGPTYRRTSTISPMVAHQYRIPRERMATNPNGCSTAIEA